MPKRSLSQYYTKPELWHKLIPEACDRLAPEIDLMKMTVVDPCAGNGYLVETFFPDNGFSFDLEPKHPRVKQADMNELDYGQFGESVAVVSNIPFNANSYPIKKMNQMAKFDNVKIIAVINASKYECYPRESHYGEVFNEYFHLHHAFKVDNRFFTGGKIGTEISFQIWIRMSTKRPVYEPLVRCELPDLMEGKIEYYVKAPTKEFLKTGKGKSPVQKTKKKDNYCYTAVRFHPCLSHVSDDKKKKLLHSIVEGVYRWYEHGRQGLSPGHLNRIIYMRRLFVDAFVPGAGYKGLFD